MSNQAHGERRAATTTARKNQMKNSRTLQDSHIVPSVRVIGQAAVQFQPPRPVRDAYVRAWSTGSAG